MSTPVQTWLTGAVWELTHPGAGSGRRAGGATRCRPSTGVAAYRLLRDKGAAGEKGTDHIRRWSAAMDG